MPTDQLNTALITGASLGIGRELAELFARDGYNLILVARHQDRLNELADLLERTYKVRAVAVAHDLSTPDAAHELLRKVHLHDLPVDILVNNAGYGTHGAFEQSDLAEQTGMLRLNMEALTQLSHLLLHDMRRRGRGRILNVSSTSAFQPGPYMAVYYATKAYVLQFSEALSVELRDSGITVTCLCPGYTPTKFQERAGLKPSALLQLVALDVRKVAERGYRGLMEGRRLVIPGRLNQLLATLVRLAPRELVADVVGNLNRGR